MEIDFIYNHKILGVFKFNNLENTDELYSLEFERRNGFEITEKTYTKIQADYPKYLDIYILPYIVQNHNKFKNDREIFNRGFADSRYICLDVLTDDLFIIFNKIKKLLLNDCEGRKLSNNNNFSG